MDPATPDANGYRMDASPIQRAGHYQRVENQQWPMRDTAGFHARGINDQPVERHVAVTVRIVFDHDGECWVDGTATRWANGCVYVVVGDQRVQTGGVWVGAGDVERI